MSSSAIRSSMLSSPDSPSMISVRRSSPYARPHRSQLVDDDLHQQPLAGEDRRAAVRSVFSSSGELVEDLLALEAGQPLQLHVENRLRLDLRQAEAASSGRRAPPAPSSTARISVMTASRWSSAIFEPFEDVIARFGLPQLELGPPADDIAPEVDEGLDQSRAGSSPSAGRRRWPA
mgnify:CR=1 FL=1